MAEETVVEDVELPQGDGDVLSRLEKFAGADVVDDVPPEEAQDGAQEDAAPPEDATAEKASVEIDPDAALFDVQVGEEPRKVSLKNLQDSYVEAEQIKAQVGQLTQERDTAYAHALEEFRPVAEQYSQNLQIIEKAVLRLAQGEFGDVDLAALARDNPAEYVAHQHKSQEWNLAIRAAREEIAKAQHDVAQRDAQERAKYIQSSVKVLKQDIPSWSDATYKELMKFAIDQGLPPERVQEEIHPGAWKLVWKAQQWDKLQQAKPEITKKVAVAPKVIKNTPKDQDGQVPRDVSNLRQQFKKSGSIRDAAAYLEKFL